MRYFWFVGLLFWFVMPVCGQQKGDTIVVIADVEAELQVNGKSTGSVLRGEALRIEEIKGEQYKIKWRDRRRHKQIKGWIHHRNVMPLKPTGKVIQFFTLALQQKPNAIDYTIRGNLWWIVGAHDYAIKDYSEAIKLDNKYSRAWERRGIARARRKEYDQALKDFNEVVKLNPQDANAWDNRALMWANKGEYDKAIKDYSEAVRINPNQENTWSNRGTLWGIKGEHKKAIKDFSEALRLNHNNVFALNNRGNTWVEIGEYDHAIRDFLEVIRIDSKNIHSLSALARLRSTSPIAKYRDGKQAVKDAIKSCELSNWKDDFYIETYSLALAETGKFVEAIEQLEKAITMNPGFAKERRRKILKLFKANKPYREVPK